MEPDHQVLGVYADAVRTLIKNHSHTKITLMLLRDRFQLFADRLKAQLKGIEVIQVGSSYDDLHLTRLFKKDDGSDLFFPEVDFDFDMIYIDYVVAENNITSTSESDINGKSGGHSSADDVKGDLQTGSSTCSSKTGPEAHFAIMESSSCPGYVKLRVTPYGRQMLNRPGCIIGNFISSHGYLLNNAFTSGLVSETGHTEIVYSRRGQYVDEILRQSGFDGQEEIPVYTKTGPAITGIQKASHGYTYDFVHAFPCPTWPNVAKGWADRARGCHWPNESLIQNIVREGCLLVPMGSHQVKDPTEEWRISFVRAERMLSSSLSYLQKTCYSVVKVMLKSVLSDQAILTSYHMKNIFYYLCEEIASASGTWTSESLGDKIIQFLKYIAVSLRVHRIPQYFLPPLNLIGHYSKEKVDATKKEVEAITRAPLSALMKACHKLGCFDIKTISQKFQAWKGELKAMFVIYMASVQNFWSQGCINIGADIAKTCFRQVVKLNKITSSYIKFNSNTFTAHSVPALLKPLAHAYTQQGDVDKALWLFLAIEEDDPELVASSYTNVFSNIACLYGNKSSQQTSERKKKEYEAKTFLYFEKALNLISDSPSLHLMYGNFLMGCKKPTLTAAKQFEKAIAIQTPCDDDDALIQLTIPGSKDQPSRPSYVPGQVAAYYLLVQCWINLMDIFQARKVARRFEEFVREKCILKHKVLACQLCAICYQLSELGVKSACMSAEMIRYEKVAKKSKFSQS
ncbi:uncharacterized protein LOC132562330 [Ylistrum balloti]|uniref:uncharacterized protein LOC132562330 n=1 Tax=Ylistrum balloti TaxID=509963 RepID=UPI002905E8DE|nr:uncharacterized protein LOC132562330 [Ylistrum balloti]